MDNFWKFATVVVGLLAAYIAYQQFWLARERLKLDLFQKRFAVFAAARLFLSQILQAGTMTMEDLWRFRAGIAEADFLFEGDITAFVTEIDRRALHLWALNERMKGTAVGPEREKLVDQFGVELEWLTSQLSMLKPTFEPYMKFAKWRWSPWRRRRQG